MVVGAAVRVRGRGRGWISDTVAVTAVADRPVPAVHPVVEIALNRLRVVLEVLVAHEVVSFAPGPVPVLPGPVAGYRLVPRTGRWRTCSSRGRRTSRRTGHCSQGSGRSPGEGASGWGVRSHLVRRTEILELQGLGRQLQPLSQASQ